MTYQLQRDGQMYGPYTLEDVRRYLASGNVLPTDLARDAEAGDAAVWRSVTQLLAEQSGTLPPTPSLGVTPAQSLTDDGRETAYEHRWFPVTATKFVVMSLVTFGIYHLYWAYKQWDRQRSYTGEAMMPWARALFAGIWNFALFGLVRDAAAADEMPVAWNHIVLAAGILLLSLLSRVHGPVALLALLTFAFYLPVVGTIEKLNATEARAKNVAELPNGSFSGWNIGGIVFGGLLLVLSLIGSFMGPAR